MKHTRKAITLTMLVILLFFQNQLNAQNNQSGAFSLKEAQEFAVKNSYSTQNSTYDIDAAKKKIWETTAIGLPQVSGSIQYQNMLDIPTTLLPDFISPSIYGVLIKEGVRDANGNPITMPQGGSQLFPAKFGTQHNTTWGISASQLIFNGSYIVGLQASRVFLELSKNKLEKSENDIRESVSQSYCLVLVLQESQQILDSTLKNINRLLYESKETLKQGLVEEISVDQIQLNVSNISNMVSSLKRQRDAAEKLLKFQMGIDVDAPITLKDNLGNILNQSKPESVLGTKFDITRNAEFKLMKTQEELSKLNLKNAQASFLPTVSAFFSYQKKAMGDNFDVFKSSTSWYPTTVVGLNIDIPIFSSGSRISKVKQAKIAYLQTQVSCKQVEQGLLMQEFQARNEYNNTLETYYKEKDNLALATKIYNITTVKYTEGVASSMELTNAQNQFLSTEQSYYSAINSLIAAKSKLDKILNIK
jgi:outer membrane protein